MSVLVKGIEMPRSCAKCMFTQVISVVDKMGYQCYLSGEIAMEREFTRRGIKNCPLVEVPTPHGRLIDADALLAEAKRISGPITGDGWDNYGVYALIERQPTVIEAEEANND